MRNLWKPVRLAVQQRSFRSAALRRQHQQQQQQQQHVLFAVSRARYQIPSDFVGEVTTLFPYQGTAVRSGAGVLSPEKSTHYGTHKPKLGWLRVERGGEFREEGDLLLGVPIGTLRERFIKKWSVRICLLQCSSPMTFWCLCVFFLQQS